MVLSPSSTRTYTRLLFLVLVVLISTLLTSRYKLAAPYDRPYGSPINLGHQAWEVSFSKLGSQLATVGSNAAVNGTTTDDDESWQEDTDELDDWGYSSAFSTKWDPLEPNSTPFTELQVKTCILSPGLYDLCSPTSSAREDATRGKWQRIDKDVSKKIGVKYLYVYARRLLPGSSADVITDLRLLLHAPTVSDLSSDGTWVEVSSSLREGVWPSMSPLFLHYKLSSQADVRAARKMDASGSAGALEPITQLDVLYGGDEVHALPGYTKLASMITGGEDDTKRVGSGYPPVKNGRVGSSLAYRKEKYDLPTPPVLRFSSKGNFTILQVADLHFSVGPGECRDVDARHVGECRKEGADAYSLKWLETALDATKPDLVVLSGDQLNGQTTSWDAQSVILKWAPLLYERKIPFTTIFGNHDEEETTLDHEGQMNLLTHLPYYIGEAGPSSVDGTGNYVRSIHAPRSSSPSTGAVPASLFSLYFLDSHANEKKGFTPWAKPGYDYLKATQVNWFRGRSAQMHTYMRPYLPASASKSSSSGSKARPSRPRPARPAASLKPSVIDLDDRRRSFVDKRQDAEDETWTDAEFEKLEEEMDAAEEAAEDGKDSYSTQVEPGGDVDNDPTDNISFEDTDETTSASTKTDTQEPGEGDVAGGDDIDPLLEAEQEAEEADGLLEPTELPVGPTAAKPLEAKPNAIAFFHIPLPQAYTSAIDVSPSGKRLHIGERLEGSGASRTDSGFFDAVLARGELPSSKQDDVPVDEFWDGESASPTTGRPEVKVLAHGHCHLTSDCRRVNGVWQCFGGGGTYSGYGNTTFSRRMRVYSLSDFGERIETYQITDEKKVINRALLYGAGSLEEQ